MIKFLKIDANFLTLYHLHYLYVAYNKDGNNSPHVNKDANFYIGNNGSVLAFTIPP